MTHRDLSHTHTVNIYRQTTQTVFACTETVETHKYTQTQVQSKHTRTVIIHTHIDNTHRQDTQTGHADRPHRQYSRAQRQSKLISTHKLGYSPHKLEQLSYTYRQMIHTDSPHRQATQTEHTDRLHAHKGSPNS